MLKPLRSLAVVLGLLGLSSGSALAAEAGNSNITCGSAQAVGVNAASTFSSYTASSGQTYYYLARQAVTLTRVGNFQYFTPTTEYWIIVPNSSNTGGSYSAATPNVGQGGTSGSYSGSIISAYGGYSFSLNLSCGGTASGQFIFGQ